MMGGGKVTFRIAARQAERRRRRFSRQLENIRTAALEARVEIELAQIAEMIEQRCSVATQIEAMEQAMASFDTYSIARRAARQDRLAANRWREAVRPAVRLHRPWIAKERRPVLRMCRAP